MEYIGKTLYYFLENHFIPTVVSIAATLIINLILPEDCLLINKLELNGARIFLFVICFLAVELFIGVRRYCLGRLSLRRYKEDKKVEALKNRKETIKKYQCVADQMSPGCRDIIIQFIKTNNKPIEYCRWISVCHKCTQIEDSLFYKTRNSNNQEIIKLTEKAYDLYSCIYNEYKRIGNF